MADCEKKLLDEKVVIIRPFLKRCSVNARLAGFNVKLKCRGSRGTFEKSEPHRVPNGGGELNVCEPSFDIVFEGDKVLDFELCDASKFRLKCNKTLARGSLAVATVFKDAGLQGTSATLTVELLSTGDQNMGWVDVDICCRIKRLGHRSLGLGALKVYSLPPRPGPGFAESLEAPQAVAWRTRKYAHACNSAGIQLGRARRSAYKLAGIERERLRGRSKPKEESGTGPESEGREG